MKKIFIAILIIFIYTCNLVFAENWVFTAPNSNYNSTYYNTNAQVVESNRPYQAYSSDDAYYGTVTTNVIPEQSYTYNNTSTTQNSEYNAKTTSFSQRHPILTGLGIGVLAVGALAVTALATDTDNYNYRRYDSHHDEYRHNDNHRPPHNNHHEHGRHDDSYSCTLCSPSLNQR